MYIFVFFNCSVLEEESPSSCSQPTLMASHQTLLPGSLAGWQILLLTSESTSLCWRECTMLCLVWGTLCIPSTTTLQGDSFSNICSSCLLYLSIHWVLETRIWHRASMEVRYTRSVTAQWLMPSHKWFNSLAHTLSAKFVYQYFVILKVLRKILWPGGRIWRLGYFQCWMALLLSTLLMPCPNKTILLLWKM